MKLEHLRKFVWLSAVERRLLITAALLLCAVRIGLWVLPFQTLRRVLAKVSGTFALPQYPDNSKEQIIWAVETSGHHMLWARTCLTQALTAQVLLAWRGHPSLIHIGVVRSDDHRLEAHAWVESEGEVVIGGFELERYTMLAALRADAQSAR